MTDPETYMEKAAAEYDKARAANDRRRTDAPTPEEVREIADRSMELGDGYARLAAIKAPPAAAGTSTGPGGDTMTVIPRWLELQLEIDYRLFLLNEMRRELEAEDGHLTSLERLIDEATGHDEARLAEAKEIIAEIKALKAEWDTLERKTS